MTSRRQFTQRMIPSLIVDEIEMTAHEMGLSNRRMLAHLLDLDRQSMKSWRQGLSSDRRAILMTWDDAEFIKQEARRRGISQTEYIATLVDKYTYNGVIALPDEEAGPEKVAA